MNRRRMVLVGSLVAACGSAGSEPAPQRPPDPGRQPPRRCLDRNSSISHVFLPAHAVGFCTDTIDEADRRRATHCQVFDRATKQFSRVPDQTVTAHDTGSPTVRAKGTDVEACAPNGGRCSTVTPRLSSIGVMATDGAATRLAVFPATGNVGELWDLDVLQRLASIRLSPNSCAHDATFVDGGIVVREEPGCTHWPLDAVLYDPAGLKLARIGGPGFDLPIAYPISLSPTSWLFCNARELAIHDRPSGALSRVLDVTKGDFHWNGICLPIDATTIVVLAQKPLAGAVAIVDLTTGSVDRYDPRWCVD